MPHRHAARLWMVGGFGCMSTGSSAPGLAPCRSSSPLEESRRKHAISITTKAARPLTIPQYAHDIGHPTRAIRRESFVRDPGLISPPWNRIGCLRGIRIPRFGQAASDCCWTNRARYEERARLVRNAHPAGPDRWNCAPRRTMTPPPRRGGRKVVVIAYAFTKKQVKRA
jgi:hypothetical protein